MVTTDTASTETRERDRRLSTQAERFAAGKALRKKAPRSSHGEWTPDPERPDPLGILEESNRGRLENLVPIRYGRMSLSPFAFLRGSAAVMASDLAKTPVSGIQAQLCGDAHLSNFGVYASPERRQVFDVNDFDETHAGPWEWDVKRLAASVVVAARHNGFSARESRQATVRLCSASPPCITWTSGISTSRSRVRSNWRVAKNANSSRNGRRGQANELASTHFRSWLRS